MSTTRPRFSWWAMTLLALPIALYALSYLVFRERLFPPDLEASFLARPWGIYPHALFGAIALLVGPFQFHRGLLAQRRLVHRVLGRVYVTAATLAGIAGTYMAWYAFGGAVTRLGFGLLGLGLLFTTTMAFVSIRGGNVAAHRQWMMRSFAFLFSAVTLRIELPILVGVFGSFPPAYRVVSWLCWVPNVLVAEAMIAATSARADLPAHRADVAVEGPVF